MRNPIPALFSLAALVATAACAADVDTVLAENESLVLSAHDSAHVRTLVIELATGVRIDDSFVPVLLLESGERLEFSTSVVPTLADSLALLPNLRVNLTPPVVGTLRLRICPPNEDKCRTLSMRVQTRGRTLRGRSS